MQILVAEDDNSTRIALLAVLKRLGHEIVSAVDGAEAWRKMQQADSPELAILDWMMPGLTGIEVCQRVRSAPGNDYITKPFDEGELIARVRVGERVLDLEQQLRNRVTELEDAMAHIKFLQGILPICMFCHRIRDDEESWRRIEDYLEEHADVQLSHGLCPQCFEKHYPEQFHKAQQERSTN